MVEDTTLNYDAENGEFPFWDRFKTLYPIFSDSLVRQVTQSDIRFNPEFHEDEKNRPLLNSMWTAYKMMSRLVYKGDQIGDRQLTF